MFNSRWRIPLLFCMAALAFVAVHIAAGVLGTPPPDARAKRASWRVGAAAALATCALLLVQYAWRKYLTRAMAVRVLLAGVLFYGFALVFMLPPFQGPDEIAHWKTALRSAGRTDELPLFNLPEILDVNRIPFYEKQKFDPAMLRSDPMRFDEPKVLGVNYAHPLSYPVVTVVSLIFPKVYTLQESLLFYYVCRLLPMVILLVILYQLSTRFDVPLATLAFFSLPLVMQQFVVVTTDTIVNLGTIAAVLLFIRLWRAPDLKLTIALWLVCIAATLAKPVAGGIFLLPLLLLPWKRLPMKAATVPAAIVGGIVAIYVASKVVLNMLAASGGRFGKDQVERQIASLQTSDGWNTFLSLYHRFMTDICDIRAWSSYLGWMDTNLSGHHHFLIWLACAFALAMDAIHFGPRIVRNIGARKFEYLMVFGVSVLNAFILSLTMALIMYISWNDASATAIAGMQVRYLFPAAIVAVLLPLLVIGEKSEDVNGEPATLSSHTRILLNTAMVGIFGFLLFARTVELMADLAVRYW